MVFRNLGQIVVKIDLAHTPLFLRGLKWKRGIARSSGRPKRKIRFLRGKHKKNMHENIFEKEFPKSDEAPLAF
jgi:hypothetical protein